MRDYISQHATRRNRRRDADRGGAAGAGICSLLPMSDAERVKFRTPSLCLSQLSLSKRVAMGRLISKPLISARTKERIIALLSNGGKQWPPSFLLPG